MHDMDQMNTTTEAHIPRWVKKFPLLRDVNDDAWVETANHAKEVVLPANYEVFHDGDPCENYIFVIDGATRAVSYTHLTLPTRSCQCRSRWSPYH